MFLMSLRDVFKCAIFDQKGQCIRHDILIRIMGARELVNGAAQPHFLYTKLSWERADSLPLTKGQTERTYPDSNLRIIDLFGSMKTRGFTHNFPLILDRNMKLVEGAHRLAMAYALHLDIVPVCITDKGASVEDLRWFESRFSRFEWTLIDAVKTELVAFIAEAPRVEATPEVLPVNSTLPPPPPPPVVAKPEPPKVEPPKPTHAPPVSAATVTPPATHTATSATPAPSKQEPTAKGK